MELELEPLNLPLIMEVVLLLSLALVQQKQKNK